MHTRTKSIKDTRHANFHTILILVRIHHGFGHAFAFVVTGTRSNGIHIAPVRLWLGMHFGISVNFRRTGEQNTRSDAFGQSKHVECSHGTRLDGLDGVVLIMRRRSWTGKVINLIDFELNGFRYVVDNHAKQRMMQPMGNISFLPSKEIVHDNDLVAFHHELIDQMTANKTGATRDQNFQSMMIRQDFGLHNVRRRCRGHGLFTQDVMIFH
mmetsp:Transcript_6621/g.13664  ORF Transcript_6621/g.13664 Transcript_6621/m.13664 type:complete len:211 (-) Transcript_6621:607-1239(-)